MIVIFLTKGEVYRLWFRLNGIQIQTSFKDPGKEFLAAIAGPTGSFLLIFLYPIWPEATLCGIAQGIFNLIPVYPMDGGRAIRSVKQWLSSKTRDRK